MTDAVKHADPQTTQAARDWIVRLASGDMDEAELRRFHAWTADPGHDAVFRHELALWRSLDAAAGRLAPRPVPRSRVPRRLAAAALAVAASLLLLVKGPDLLLRMEADHVAGHAVSAVDLPDGSLIRLDADAAVALRYGDGAREVELLRGRAWFQVAHGDPRPFRVSAHGGVAEDVGTAFEVERTAKRALVGVTEGRVRVGSRRDAPDWHPLGEGERASWSADGKLRLEASLPASRIAAWRDGQIVLDAVPAARAVAEIGRYRGGPTLVFGDMDTLPSVTAVVLADRADEGLDALAATLGLDVTRLPGGVAIVRPGR